MRRIKRNICNNYKKIEKTDMESRLGKKCYLIHENNFQAKGRKKYVRKREGE